MKLLSTQKDLDKTERIETELVQMLYKQAPGSLIVTVLNLSIAVLVLLPVAPQILLFVWSILLFGITASRFFLVHLYNTTNLSSNQVEPWRSKFLVGVGAAGAVWGAAGLIFFPYLPVQYQFFLAFILGGMAVGAIAPLSAVPRAFCLFSLPVLLPLAGQFFIQDESMALAMGLLSLSFLGALLVTAHHLHTSIVETCRVRIDNLDLMHDLCMAKEQTENANQQLRASNATLTEAIRESQLSAERFRSLCASSPIGIFQTDVSGACVYFNPRGLEIVGQTLEDCLGIRWMKSVVPEDRDAISTRWKADFQAGNEFSHEFRLARAHGEIRWVHARAAPMQTTHGALIGYVGTMEDITQRRSVERMKAEFVSVVSHELRTPLTSIRGALGLVASKLLGELSEKGQRMLEIAISNTDRLVRLINDTLDIERLESGKVTIQKQACDTTTVLTQAVDVMSPMAEKAGVTISASPRPLRLWADPDRIIQTLTNLLSNAIKFSPPGGTVWLTAEPNGEYILFRILDQGRGIPAEKIESIFERFEQVDASDARDKGGSGLGLAICRSIVQQHAGRIWAESTIDQGSSFCFTLPALHEQSPKVCTLPDTSPSVVKVEEPSEDTLNDNTPYERRTAHGSEQMSAYH